MDQKKTDYGNWVPLALMKRLAAIAGALLAGEVLLIVLDGPTALTLLVGGLLAAAVILVLLAVNLLEKRERGVRKAWR